MKKGESQTTNLVLRKIGQEKILKINEYINQIIKNKFYKINNQEEIQQIFQENTNNFIKNLTEEEQLNIKFYTGYYYKYINSILRNIWKYEENGPLNEKDKEIYQKIAYSIKESIKISNPMPINIYTYRGTNLDAFKEYNITNIKELIELKGNFFYESGFTSTSLLEENSYYNQKTDDNKENNINITYLIPQYSNDGICICHEKLSYSPNQTEYLITSGTLFKILDVKINNNKADIKMILIPNKIYECEEKLMNNNKKR